MRKMEVRDITPSILRIINKGNPIIITHNGKKLGAVIPLELLNLLEGLQLESLEEEDAQVADEINNMLRSM